MFAGLFPLIKLIFRRDRIKLPVWIICFTVFLLWMIPLLKEMYSEPDTLATLYQTFALNPAGIFLTGMMDNASFGALITIETVLWWGLAIAFMNILLVVRHTRQNEEMGAQELIQSCRVGRWASLLAVLKVAFLTNLIITVALGFGMTLLTDQWSASQSWLYAIAMGLFGLTWAAITAVVAQLFESTRSVIGTMSVLVGAAFMLRGVGDFMGAAANNGGLIQPMWISYLSPFGWMQATRALTYPEWWPLIIFALFIIVAIVWAFFLQSVRDVGAGILPSRAGRDRAKPFRRTLPGLTWYLQKNIFLGWFIGTLSFIVIIGWLVPEMSDVFDSSEFTQQLIQAIGGIGAIIPAFLSTFLMLTAIAVGGYVMQGLGKMRGEEAKGYLENLLATRVSRFKWLALHVSTVLIGGTLILVLSAVVLAVSTNLLTDVDVSVWEFALAGLSYVPVLLAFVGAFVLLFGLIPRAAGAIVWTYYGFIAFATWIGPMIGMPDWLMNFNIMTHIAAAPANDILVTPLLIITGGAIVAFVAGNMIWRNRDLVAS